MGEAKRKLERVRAEFLAELERWSFPASEWEERTVAEIQNLPVVQVIRYPQEKLEWMRMQPRQCHVNARFMQENDPDGLIKQVSGWWVQDDHYVLHSVIDQYGDLVCVTPSILYQENQFNFVPDEKIEWRNAGDVRLAYRDGVEVGPGVRANPADSLNKTEDMRRRLISGMNPYDAIKA